MTSEERVCPPIHPVRVLELARYETGKQIEDRVRPRQLA
jgi:hypothetical protein